MEYGFYIYILKCNNGVYYVGHTDNIENRLQEHAAGMCNYTSKRLPVELLYTEQFQTRDEAFVAERKIKGWSRKKKEAFMQQNFEKMHILAQCQSEKSSTA